MTSVALPGADEAPLCADFARENNIDPGGTALAPAALVLVEVAEPWPKPVGKHPDMVEIVAAAQQAPGQIRVLAAVPHDPQRRRMICFRPRVAGTARSEVEISQSPADDLRRVLDGMDHRVISGRDQVTMLVCTQGTHDVCCGTLGNAFAHELAAARPDVELFRVSHTGGHRFSPTAMTLPDGRMWANLGIGSTEGIIDRRLDPATAVALCRGWWGAPTGPAQIAERAVFGELGWAIDDADRTVEVSQQDDGTYRVSVAVAWPGGSQVRAVVMVEPGRQVPTIACNQPGGEPVKPGREWRVQSVIVTSTN